MTKKSKLELIDIEIRLNADGKSTISLDVRGKNISSTIQVSLALHCDICIEWWASLSCELHEGKWEGIADLQLPDFTDCALEIHDVKDAEGSKVKLNKQWFFIKNEENGWQGRDIALERLKKITLEREKRYNKPIIHPGNPKDNKEFTVIILAKNLLLQSNQQVTSLLAQPQPKLSDGNDLLNNLTALLKMYNINGEIDKDSFVEAAGYMSPLVSVYANNVLAPSSTAARDLACDYALTFLDLLAFRRHNKPQIIGGIVGEVELDESMSYAESWIEGPIYSGNVLGGPLSGEDQFSLVSEWDKIQQQPQIGLWLSLYADALAETRWDYKLFRCFNLVEGIAKEIYGEEALVEDSKGQPLMKDRKHQYTTNDAAGSVYKMTLSALTAGQIPDQEKDNSTIDYWHRVRLWVAIRNSVAHSGSYNLIPLNKPNEQYKAQLLGIKSLAITGSLREGANFLVWEIKELTGAVLKAALKDKLKKSLGIIK